MPSIVPSVENHPLPPRSECTAILKILEGKLRYDPDAGDLDADLYAIVNAYATGELVMKGSK